MKGPYQHIKVHFSTRFQLTLLLVVVASFGCNRPASKEKSPSWQPGAPPAIHDGQDQKATSMPRSEWGAALVRVSDSAGTWTLSGKKQQVRFDAADFTVKVKAGTAHWDRKPSASDDIIVREKGQQKTYPLRLADAEHKKVDYYDAGYKTGIKNTLSGWKDFDLTLYLTICLEAHREDLLFTVAAKEDQTLVQQLDWPTALDGSTVDYTVLPNFWGILLPGRPSKTPRN